MVNPFRIRHNIWRLRQIVGVWRAERAVTRFRVVRRTRPHRLPARLAVAVTSYPARYPELHKTLRSLLDQTVAADRTILFIAHGDLDRLPADVLDLKEQGLEIAGCDDLRSYKKIIPLLEAEWSGYVLTADDDAYYPPDWIASLVEVGEVEPESIIAARGRIAQFDAHGRATEYKTWVVPMSVGAHVVPAEARYFPTGVGGVLYPPKSLASQVTDRALFTALCPNGDDLWLYWMARLNGTQHRQAKRIWKHVVWNGTQETALFNSNSEGGNMQQIRALEAHFGALP